MDEYTFKDVIIDPTLEKARACIGKVCYYSDNPTSCIEYANSNYNDKAGILKSIKLENYLPFCFDTREKYYCCIILKKEKPKVYVPFSSVDEFLSTYFEKCESIKQKVNTHNEDILCNHGIWIKDKTTGYISMVVELRENGVSRECGVLETINKDNYEFFGGNSHSVWVWKYNDGINELYLIFIGSLYSQSISNIIFSISCCEA